MPTIVPSTKGIDLSSIRFRITSCCGAREGILRRHMEANWVRIVNGFYDGVGSFLLLCCIHRPQVEVTIVSSPRISVVINFLRILNCIGNRDIITTLFNYISAIKSVCSRESIFTSKLIKSCRINSFCVWILSNGDISDILFAIVTCFLLNLHTCNTCHIIACSLPFK